MNSKTEERSSQLLQIVPLGNKMAKYLGQANK